MRRVRIGLTALIAAVLSAGIVLGVTGCSSTPTVEVGADTVIVDVRTPEEFATGHLDGAVNISWEGNFASEIASLPTDGDYLLYCRSGNRAGQALAAMQSLGFSNVTNLGSVQDASSATGIAIVK